MSVQTTYGYATGKGIAGGIYDMFHYPVESRFNEEENGVLRFGVGVVRGSIAGSNIALPTEDSTAADFEGVVVNGFSNQQDLEGRVFIMNNQNIGVMRKGKIWVRIAEGETPAYGDAVYMVADGEEAGFFGTEGDIAINARFIGAANNGLAPIELFDGVAGGSEPYTLPTASADTLGGVKVGTGLNISADGKLNVG